MDALTLHRLHFAFTITYHYLFPQLTMGLEKPPIERDALSRWAEIFQAPTREEMALFDEPLVKTDPVSSSHIHKYGTAGPSKCSSNQETRKYQTTPKQNL